MNNCKFFFITAAFLYSIVMYTKSNVSHQNHVSFFLKNKGKNQNEINIHNNKIHEATFEIKQQCKKRYKDSIEKNFCYPHRRDTVFFVDYNQCNNYWTLYKPSFIPYNQFVKLAQKIYKKYGLQVSYFQDAVVKITQTDTDLENRYLTLDALESYKKKPELDDMQKYLFWYLKMPTTGLLPNDEFGIVNEYKPLAWHFLLWDLAPKKGQGARVAMIDTGVSAFNIKEKEFSEIYKKNINITAPDNLLDYNYNLISKQGLDPIRQIVINFEHYCDHQKFDSQKLTAQISNWIIDLVKNHKADRFRQYFIENAKKEYVKEGSIDLNEKGEATLKDLLYGKYGIIPNEKNLFFTVVNLDEPYNQQVILETLPAPKIIGNKDSFAAGHGTFTQGIVNGDLYNNLGIHGLAPKACVTMIKAFHDDGTTNKTTLCQALTIAKTLGNPIVNMSLKITDDINTVTDMPLKNSIDSIDYVVAACGNDGTNEKLKNKEAYPAKFDSVAFDVGAFGYNDGNYLICPFTQKEINVGPKFVAPGYNLLSAGLVPNQKTDSMYLFMSGTSIAVPVITGFLALVLGEFENIFTREQILKVIYRFSIQLNNDEIWQKYIKVGTPDMRSCLLCLHVLESLQKSLKERGDLKYSFHQNFNNLVEAIYAINYYIPSQYEKISKISLAENFAGYCQSIAKNSIHFELDTSFSNQKNISECILFIQDLILSTIDPSKKHYTYHIKKYAYLSKQLQTILTKKNLNLFANKSTSTQKRISLALKKRVEK